MDTKEMSLLIDTIFDIAEAVSVDTTYYDVLKGVIRTWKTKDNLKLEK